MNLLKRTCFFMLLIPLSSSEQESVTELPKENQTIVWMPAHLIEFEDDHLIIITGKPEAFVGVYGKSLRFNGSTDGLFLDNMPLSGKEEFTIEAIFYPESGGNFEQRFFHTGEIRGDRVLLEIRTTAADWYFDAFIQSGDQQKALIDSTLRHPL